MEGTETFYSSEFLGKYKEWYRAMVEKYGDKKSKSLKYKEHATIQAFYYERMQLSFFDLVDRARKIISFYGIY